ncbi:MAG: hypothetical protein AAF653_07865, partial [Chloroflexota bacterium]
MHQLLKAIRGIKFLTLTLLIMVIVPLSAAQDEQLPLVGKIAYRSDGNIYILNLSTGMEREFLQRNGGELLVRPDWSNDGLIIA